MNFFRHLIGKPLPRAGLLCLVLASAPATASSETPLLQAGSGNIEQLHVGKLLQHQPAGIGAGNASLRAPVAAPIMPQRLAKSLPLAAAQQREAQQKYEQMLSIYRQSMQQGGLPNDDIGIALGAFIVANYQIASDSSVDDEASKATYVQMQRLAAGDGSLQKLDNASRQALFEELAIMAMTMEVIFEQAWEHGDRLPLERAQPAARQYLQTVLQRSFTDLRFNEQGLSFAGR